MVLPMHRLPQLQWQTWMRLAFVEPGSDWRSLNKLRVADGFLQDFRLAPSAPWNNGSLGVNRWEETAGTVTGNGRPASGNFSVADPRSGYTGEYHQIGVRRWEEPGGTVTGQMQVGGGPNAIADPRYGAGGLGEHAGKMRVEDWDGHSHTVTGSDRVGSGALSIADPRINGAPRFNHVYRIVPWGAPAIAGSGGPAGGLCVSDPRPGYKETAHRSKFSVSDWQEPSGTVTGSDHVTGGAMCVADPRTGLKRPEGADFADAGSAYGVLPWDATASTVTAAASHDNGRWSVADPRAPQALSPEPLVTLPAAKDRLVAVIIARDGTYHRPFSTLELAALQSLVDPDEVLELHGASDSAWRERIGNAVPPDAAEAIASVMGTTLLLAWSGETFQLNAMPVWVQPVVVALTVKSEQPW